MDSGLGGTIFERQKECASGGNAAYGLTFWRSNVNDHAPELHRLHTLRKCNRSLGICESVTAASQLLMWRMTVSAQ